MSVNNQPLVSIILPVYNGAEFLSDCLKSLSSQTYQNTEIIVVDDGSKDSSIAILKEWRKKDRRIKVFKNIKRYGIGVCLNRALKHAKGEYISFMDQSDINSPYRLQKQVNFLENNPKSVVLGSQYTDVDKKNRLQNKSNLPLDHEAIYHTLLSGTSIKFETVMINRTLLPKDVLKFPPYFHTFMPTQRHSLYTKLFVEIISNGYGEFANLSDFLYRSRKVTDLSLNSISFLTILRLWLKSLMMYDYRPSLRSLFVNTLINTNK